MVDSLRDFDGFVLGVICGCKAWHGEMADGGVVGVEFDHGGAGCNGIRAVDLDLVVALGVGEGNGEGKEDEGVEKSPQENSLGRVWVLASHLDILDCWRR